MSAFDAVISKFGLLIICLSLYISLELGSQVPSEFAALGRGGQNLKIILNSFSSHTNFDRGGGASDKIYKEKLI